ncbi:MAG: 2,3-bisphosphoglycerate-independent phosphoglycerate mutase [Malacoplasma sp.]|nr:2,3-bisphosphoglycerate-independent phosphoglycerate mutase [Malacoplasma sp.]MDE5775015.1 2,3-bisphosphoglycerate-independent phosphoglycerate mutase [Malacoplasma sp.]MDE7099763.1 2,3-bisphosphoglycerate-independent phosphoglycerate mutase [Malacoplasma sp.]
MSKKPVLLAILDGFGFSKQKEGNAIYNAKTPFFDNLIKTHDHCYIEASGEFVGLPDGQIGNSEVGHLTIGAGRVVYTGLSLINYDIKTGNFDNNPTLLEAIAFAKKNNSNIHIMGLLSPGGVHSSEDHIFEMIRIISKNGLKPIVHVFGDGRDVEPQSIISSIKKLQDVLHKYGGEVATISGRFYAMDRDKRWERTKLAYDNLLGIGINYFDNLISYVQSQYDKNIYDEFLEPARKNDSSLNIKDNDVIIHANFRPDRARQLSHLFCGSTVYDEVNDHPLKNNYYATMMTYEGITPTSILFPTVVVKNTFGEVVSNFGLKQLRIAETEKYAHVTFFFDGGIETEYLNEDKILIDSPKVKTYDEIPEMSAIKITDKLLEKMSEYDVIILNFANADMVGHTGKYTPAVKAIEVLDSQLARIDKKIKELNGTMFITADHGNAEDMIDQNGEPVTKHTTNPVLFISNNQSIRFKKPGSLANVAPTILDFMGLTTPAEMDKPSLLIKK